MQTQSLSKNKFFSSSILEDIFKPWNNWPGFSNADGIIQMPAVNVVENENTYEVSLAAPGLTKGDFDITVNDNILTVSSTKENSSEDKGDNYTRREYNYSSFTRSFTLPEEVDRENVTAPYTDGLLKISLIRMKDKKREFLKKISIN